ncbi:MAG: NUDIX hydrolase [Solirubrobacteraceae bacterium]|nr:NUDIX hydrolase [Solirubrobacteraceae bacterium]
MSGAEPEIRAAGGVVVRDDGFVLVVHRPRYDDWSLPKGKLDRGESWEGAALREVEEETGMRCVLGAELPPVRYEAKGRLKEVRYWRMTPVGEAPPEERDDEVDELQWLAPEEAAALMTYAHDAELIRAAMA